MNNNIRRLLVTLALGMGLALALLALGLTLTHARTQNSISMIRITIASDANRDSDSASMSADGTLITFVSDSDLLGQGIPDEQYEIWLYDTTTLTYTRVTSTSNSGRYSSNPRLSADGTTIVFSSDADFLGQGIPAGQYETWLYDVPGKTLTRVTTASSSGRGSWGESLSADGTLVAISSDSDFSGQGIPAGQYEIWLYDTTTLTYTRVTTASESNRQSFLPHLNADGTLLAFQSDSDFLGQGISAGQYEIWLYDIPSGELTRVTYGSGSDRGSYAPCLSADGTQLAFTSDVDFWGQGISQYQYEVWLYDVNGGVLTRVTTASESNRGCDYATLNADGTRLAFQSDSDYFGQGIPNDQQEIWLYDIPSETFTRVTTESGTDRDSAVPSLSADGTLLAFDSDSDFLGQGIQNGQNEVWLFGLPLPAPSLSKEVDDETPRPGQRVTFTLSVVNPYTTTLTDAVISDTLPVELSFAGPVSLDPSQPGAVLADDAGDLPTLVSGLTITAETAVTLTFPVTVSDGVAWGTIITNTASLASTQIPTPTFGSVVLHVMFHVTSADPAPNSHDAALDTDLFFTANSAVSATSVTTGTVFVHGGFQGHLDGSFSFGSVTFDPAGDLHPGELVQASVTGGVLNGSGEPIAPYVWEFRAATQGGAGVFSPHPATPSLPTYQTTGAALGDLDGDGDLDALLSSSGAETVWLNDGAGGLTPHPTTPSFGADSSRDVALGDLNGDGSLDALVANALTETVWLNDGAGNLTPHPTTPSLGAGNSSDVELGDLDRDGDLDALLLYSDQADYVWLNDGAGNLTPHPTTPTFGEGNSSGAKLGDLDGDGDLDAVIAKRGSQLILVWGNDGAGNFYFHNSFGSRDCYGLELGDLDGDGDLDTVTVYDDRPSAVWLNDGAGHFAAHPITPEFGAGNGVAIALGDVDGDGDPDALVARDDNLSQTVWLNDGAGNLTAGGDFGAGLSSGLALGDLDGDGDLDVVVSDNSGLDTTVWLNRLPYQVMLPLVLRNQ